MNSAALNYDSRASFSDGSCRLPVQGCTDSRAINYALNAQIDDRSCQITGCTDSRAYNFNVAANVNDQSCKYPLRVCLDSRASNFYTGSLVGVVSDNAVCIFTGCTDPIANNYNPTATQVRRPLHFPLCAPVHAIFTKLASPTASERLIVQIHSCLSHSRFFWLFVAVFCFYRFRPQPNRQQQ